MCYLFIHKYKTRKSQLIACKGHSKAKSSIVKIKTINSNSKQAQSRSSLISFRPHLHHNKTITNTQRIRIYPEKLKFILVKISPDSERLHGKHAKENKLLSRFLLLEIYPDSPVYRGPSTERIQMCPVML